MSDRVSWLPPVATHLDCTMALLAAMSMRDAKAYMLATSMLRIAAILHREASYSPADMSALAEARAILIKTMTIGDKNFAEISAEWPEELRQLFE
jgi:hypothetical protein